MMGKQNGQIQIYTAEASPGIYSLPSFKASFISSQAASICV